MIKSQRIVFWIVASLAAVVSISGMVYAWLAVCVPLHVNMFGHPYPAWMLGSFVAAWGGYTGYRLYRVYIRTAGLNVIP